MKLVIFSDNHKDVNSLENIFKYNMDADKFISLGDSEIDSKIFKENNVISVRGNSPLDPEYPYELVLNYYNKRILLVHGHKQNVKFGLRKLYYKALEEQADIVLFGHSHLPKFEKIDDCIFLNPGSTFLPKKNYPCTYAIIYLDDDVKYEFRSVLDNKIITI